MFMEIYKQLKFDLNEVSQKLEYYIPWGGKNIEEALIQI